jgi:hypothetical protein
LASFLGYGRIEIGSNTRERAIRPISLKRKRTLFAANEYDGVNWAALPRCKMNATDPLAYLADVLAKLFRRCLWFPLAPSISGWAPAAKVVDFDRWRHLTDVARRSVTMRGSFATTRLSSVEQPGSVDLTAHKAQQRAALRHPGSR